jgi:hypothetical protein
MRPARPKRKSATAMTLWVTSTTTRIHSVIMLVVAPLLDD